ncbi:hypothetical protein O1611_g1228 [Lasiodiplodia mahajangana]|uniref:Uncharacterized protein n=1 Tax=Lasiodiplodia mahajangana TaxID=1108764 RepID=A0ACC2JY06_9PEZI|nr:hypothetical protein O1611_g1228 [Lasiodiplodia mahajangana]
MATRVELGRQRILSDIHELVTKPYPKIALHPHEDDIYRACLVFYPENYPPLHLSIIFRDLYPIEPPSVRMDSSIEHPNVMDGWICATILRRGPEYTPAYTLKGIAIQLLSFFDSSSLEQEHWDWNESLSLNTYQDRSRSHSVPVYECQKCRFGMDNPQPIEARPSPRALDACVDQSPGESPTIKPPIHGAHFHINKLPVEILLQIFESLDDFEHLVNLARAWPKIGRIVHDFNVIRQRELHCFCLKKDHKSAKLGVGVRVHKGHISSEFDLLSAEAYKYMGIRRSIHNIRFDYWLPLPISRRHWDKVREDAHNAIAEISREIKVLTSSILGAQVIITFMNDIVVQFSQTTNKIGKSTLIHASDKAMESYFHLFHLLVCLATDDPSIVQQANKLLKNWEDGKRSKADCPNLGHLLIILLISDVQVTDTLIKSIITEAIVRNVVWLLDGNGANMAELSYMERNAVSAYRLDKTFQGSRTSYRLLMFSELFRRTARPFRGKTLIQVRDELFDRQGGPPLHAAGHLAAEVRRLHTIDNFPAFMKEMGLRNIPTAANFTHVLRGTVRESMARGYSRWAISQVQAARLRLKEDPHIQLTKEEFLSATPIDYRIAGRPKYSFFPNNR